MSINYSEESKEAVKADDVCCASCGIAPVDDIKLKILCDGCRCVSYCSDICQEDHREQHEEECKQRKAELYDNELFEQPEKTCFGECQICFLPIPLDQSKSSFLFWLLQKWCVMAVFTPISKSSGNNNCPFCREPAVNGGRRASQESNGEDEG